MKNPPSFQFYPQDFLSDLNVQSMTDDEVGAYIKLLCHCWIEDGLPADGTSRVVDLYFKKSPTVARCFVEIEGKYRNQRLDLERDKQRRWREKCSKGGLHSAKKKRLIKRSSTKPQVKVNSSSSSSSSIKKGFKKNLSPQYSDLALFLESRVRENVPHHRFTGKDYLTSWAREFRLMVERDKIPIESVRAVLEWSLQDEFWRINILSAGTFREKFGRLEAKAKSGSGRGEYKASQVGRSTKPIDPKTAASMERSREIHRRLVAEAKAAGDTRPDGVIWDDINDKAARLFNLEQGIEP